jgi:hypothetical protein
LTAKLQFWTDDVEILTLLNRVIGNEYGTLSLSAEDWLLKPLTRLAKLAEYASPAEQIILEDLATYILKKVLDYANSNLLGNFKLSLQQEQKYYPIKSANLKGAGRKLCAFETCSLRTVD